MLHLSLSNVLPNVIYSDDNIRAVLYEPTPLHPPYLSLLQASQVLSDYVSHNHFQSIGYLYLILRAPVFLTSFKAYSFCAVYSLSAETLFNMRNFFRDSVEPDLQSLGYSVYYAFSRLDFSSFSFSSVYKTVRKVFGY